MKSILVFTAGAGGRWTATSHGRRSGSHVSEVNAVRMTAGKVLLGFRTCAASMGEGIRVKAIHLAGANGKGSWQATLEEEAKHGADRSAWVRVEDSVPDDEMTVLIALSDGEVWTGFLDAGEWRFVCGELVDQGEGTRVTHWCDFPEPPNDQAQPRAGHQDHE